MTRNVTLRGTLLLLLATICWGGMFPVTKSALLHIDGVHLTVFRYGLGVLLFVATMLALEGREALRFEGRFVETWLFGSSAFAGFSLFMFAGLPMTRAEHGAVIVATMPLITALINWLFRGQRPPLATIAAMLIALVGVTLVVTKGDLSTLGDGAVLGDALIFVGALCWALYTLGSTRFPTWSSLRFTTMSCIAGVTTIFAVAIASDLLGYAHVPAPSDLAAVWPELAFTLILASFVAVIAWNTGVRLMGPLDSVLFANVVPLTAMAIGVAQGHYLNRAELIGAALTIIALILSNIAARRAAAVSLRTASASAAN
jgi:drug/metabolite transporter (DMT)-like permease